MFFLPHDNYFAIEAQKLDVREIIHARTSLQNALRPPSGGSASNSVKFLESHALTFFFAGVRKGVSGAEIAGVLPQYITAEHFQAALPHFPAVLRQLLPEHKGFPPTTGWLDVIPKLMNTAVVLLCDKVPDEA